MVRIPSWRFRLSTLLLLVTLTGLGIALFLAKREQDRLARENRSLRQEFGVPIVTDPTRIAIGQTPFSHITSLGSGADDLFYENHTFRIYCPPGRKLKMFCAFEGIEHGFPQGAPKLDLSGLGENVVIQVRVKFAKKRMLEVNLAASGTSPDGGIRGTTSFGTRAKADHWLFEQAPPSSSYALIGGLEQQHPRALSEPDTPIALVRHKADNHAGAQPRTAVLVWLDEVK